MDNIWIFLIIIGAAVSFMQKSQQNKQNRGPKSDNEEEVNLDPHKEIERHIRRILQEEEKRPKMSTAPLKKEVSTGSPCPMAKAPKTAPVLKNQLEAAKPTESSESNERIEEILDDFSIEKAVIYSEILNPKYKEY